EFRRVLFRSAPRRGRAPKPSGVTAGLEVHASEHYPESALPSPSSLLSSVFRDRARIADRRAASSAQIRAGHALERPAVEEPNGGAARDPDAASLSPLRLGVGGPAPVRFEGDVRPNAAREQSAAAAF